MIIAAAEHGELHTHRLKYRRQASEQLLPCPWLALGVSTDVVFSRSAERPMHIAFSRSLRPAGPAHVTKWRRRRHRLRRATAQPNA